MERKATNTGHAFISRLNNGRYLLTIPKSLRDAQGIDQQKKSSDSLEELVIWRNELFGEDFDENVPGLTRPLPKKQKLSATELWEGAIADQAKLEAAIEEPWYPITAEGILPFAFAFMSDAHMGSPYVNYKLLRQHTQIVKETPGMNLIVVGDEHDNMMTEKLYHARFENTIPMSQELLMFKYWLEDIQDDCLAYVTGNHDLWSYKKAGIDLAELLLPRTVLYDKYEVRIVIKLYNGREWKVRIRHRWPGRSYLNLTNGLERDWQFCPYDIAIGGDYHDGTICREFIRDGQVRFAILLGTYKNLDDPFHKMVNKQQSPHVGSATIIFHPNGTMEWQRDIEQAAEYLTWLRGGR